MKKLFVPALTLWIIAGIIYLISPWYYGPDNIYDGFAHILVLIGLFLTLIERYILKKATQKRLIGFGIAFLLFIIFEWWTIVD